MTGPECAQAAIALLRDAHRLNGAYVPDGELMIAEAHAWVGIAHLLLDATRTPEGLVADQIAWRRAAAPEGERTVAAA